MNELILIKPDDWHVHFREGDSLGPMLMATAQDFARALVMPNVHPPLTSLELLQAYRDRMISLIPEKIAFTPYVTFYINESLRIEDLYAAKAFPYILGGKLYPKGATTNSEQGVQSIQALFPLFAAMQELDLVLQIHGEVTEGDIFAREALFIGTTLRQIAQNFPKLRMVIEHISTKTAVEFVEQAAETVAATITAHHLFYNRNDMLVGGIKPHYYCLPILKKESDQKALQLAAVSGNPKFFAGSDSAPHVIAKKESHCGCAGIFSAPFALPIYAEVFDNLGKLKQLEAFTSLFGAAFYQLPCNTEKMQLLRKRQLIPEVLDYPFGKIVPVGAGTELQWSVASNE